MSLHREDVSRLRAVIRAAAARGELLERAVEGLTDEQVAAIPRLIAWARVPSHLRGTAWGAEGHEIQEIFGARS